MPVLAVGVVVQAAHYDRTAGRATGGRGKGIEKKGSVFGEGVDGRSLGYFVSIATEGGGFVISDEEDDLYQTALKIIKTEKKASTSFLQRKLQIGYNRAARIIDQMEDNGVVSKANHVGKREVL